jgi:hypothetical protein
VKRRNILTQNLPPLKTIQFVHVIKRSKGDSVKEIADYWGNASIEEIHDRVIAWQTKRTPKV